MNVENHTRHPRVPDIMCGFKIGILSLVWLAQQFHWLSHIFGSRAPEEDSPGFHRSPLSARKLARGHSHAFTGHRWLRAWAHMCPGTEKVTAPPKPQRSQRLGWWRPGLGLIRDFPINTARPRNQLLRLLSMGFLTILKKLCVHPSLDEHTSSCFGDYTHTKK